MKRILLILLVFIGLNCIGQNFDNLMTKKVLDCSDVSYNSALLFQKYYTENKIDSAKNLLAYWQGKCGMREPLQRARILLAIKEGNFQDSILTWDMLTFIFNYKERVNMEKHNSFYTYDNYKSYFGFVPVGQEFDKFTKKSFGELKGSYRPEQMENLLCEFYSDNCDTIFSKIQTNTYRNSILSQSYFAAVDKYLDMSEIHLSWVTGVWIPRGNLKIVGVHPELGFQMGVKHNKMNYDFAMIMKLGNSPNNYYARRKGSTPQLTDHFLGGLIGLDIGRDIFARNGHEIQVLGGVAADGFDALEENKDLGLKVASTWSYNFNIGLGYRYYLNNGLYLGLRAKYNFVDYTLSKVVDFTGNPISVQFIIGGVSNYIRTKNLKDLKYKFRK